MEDLELNNKRLKDTNDYLIHIIDNLNSYLLKPIKRYKGKLQEYIDEINKSIKYKLSTGYDNIFEKMKSDNREFNRNTSESTKNSFIKQQSEAIKNSEDNEVKKSKFGKRRL